MGAVDGGSRWGQGGGREGSGTGKVRKEGSGREKGGNSKLTTPRNIDSVIPFRRYSVHYLVMMISDVCYHWFYHTLR